MKKNYEQPLILLVSQCAEENKLIRNWLNKHQVMMCETGNVFEALETLTDFTLERCPDVIMLQVESPSRDLAEITEMIEVYSDSKKVMVAALSSDDKVSTRRHCTIQHITHPNANLDGLLPALSRAATRNFL